MSRTPKQSGFSLVELVTVIVLLGILSVSSATLIRSSIETYVDSTRRNELTQQARFLIERISREVRNALPGSIRVAAQSGVQCLEFMPIEASSIYLTKVAESSASSFQAVDFSFTTAAVSDYEVAIYTLDGNDVYHPSSTAISSLASVGAESGGQRQVNLSASFLFANEAPQQRFYIVRHRVSFCVSDGIMRREENYSAGSVTQPVPPTGASSGLLAEHIRVTDENGSPVTVFSFSPGTLARSAIVHLDLHFQDSSASDEWFEFSQEIFIRNSP